MNHNFDIKIATEYGLNEAIIFNNIYFWITKNKANKKHFYKNNYWTFNSYKAFAELFPYFSERQIRYAINNLIKDGLIIKGNFNIKNYDNTNWYTLTNKGWKFTNEDMNYKNDIPSDKSDSADLTNLSDGLDKNVRPIPDINTDINTNINNISSCATSETEVAPVDKNIATPTKYKFPCKPSKNNKKTEWVLSQEDLDWYLETYPNLDINTELRKAWRWLKDNNLKTYQGMSKYISGWLARANDKTPSKKSQNLKDKAREIYIQNNRPISEVINQSFEDYKKKIKEMRGEINDNNSG